MALFRSRPSEADAEQYRTGEICRGVFIREDGTAYCITMHEKETEVVDGDWIIREPVPDRFYPCKPSVFDKKYERVV